MNHLFEKNIECFEEKAPGFSRMMSEYVPNNIRAELSDEEVYLYDGMRLLKGSGYKEYEQKVFEDHIKSPCRLIMPSCNLDWNVEKVQKQKYLSLLKECSDSNWISQKYDDGEGALHTGFFVVDLAETLANTIEIADAPVTNKPYFLTIWGAGLGSQIINYLKTYKPKVLILIEDNFDILYWSLHVTDWTEIFAYASSLGCKVNLTFQTTWSDLHSAVITLINLECPISIDSTIAVYSSDSSAMLRAFRKFNSPELANLVNFTGFTVDEYNMVKNSFKNLSNGKGKIVRHFFCDHEVPVVIVASGPSLNESLDWLRTNQDNCIIITSGSSLPVLISNGIRVDFQLVIERDKYMHEVHRDDIEIRGLDYSSVRCFASTTIWPGISDMFGQVYWFFRAALTPLAIFSSDPSEIIYSDGPQTVNLAATLATMLKPKKVYMVGVDLGAASSSNPRAKGAHGVTERNLSVPTRGNQGTTVFSDTLLLTVRDQLSKWIKVHPTIEFINLSGGVKIDGSLKASIEDISLTPSASGQTPAEVLDSFDLQMPDYTKERFEDQWYSHNLRQETMIIFSNLRVIANSVSDSWGNDLMKAVWDLLDYSKKNLREQAIPRLIRGDVMRWFMTIDNAQRRCVNDEGLRKLLTCSKEVLLRNIDAMEIEIYSLFDELENFYDEQVELSK